MSKTTSGYFDSRATGRPRPTLLPRFGATMAPPIFQETISRITNAPPSTPRMLPECQCRCSQSGTSRPCQTPRLPVPPEPLPLTTIEQQIQERCLGAARQLLEPAFRELAAGIATM